MKRLDSIPSACMDQLAVKIRQSFGSGTPPPFPDFGPNWKFSEAFEETGYFVGKAWDALSVSDFETYTCCHSFFPDNAASYYFGANMYVECVSKKYWSYAMSPLFMDLDWRFSPKKRVFGLSSRLGVLWKQMTEPQKSTVLEYLDLAIMEGPKMEIEGIRDALAKVTHASWGSGQ